MTSNPSVDLIQKVVARSEGMAPGDLLRKSQARSVSMPRQIAMYLCRKLTRRSLPDIGPRFGLHHTTVLYAARQVAKKAATDPKLAARLEDLERAILARHAQLQTAIPCGACGHAA